MKTSKLINLQTITNSTSTNQDGDLLFDYLANNAVKSTVVLKIPSNSTLSSSFLNSSIGKFIDVFGLDIFKSNIQIKSTQNIFNQLKKYIGRYTGALS